MKILSARFRRLTRNKLLVPIMEDQKIDEEVVLDLDRASELNSVSKPSRFLYKNTRVKSHKMKAIWRV